MNRGISLIALIITVIAIIVLSAILIFNTKPRNYTTDDTKAIICVGNNEYITVDVESYYVMRGTAYIFCKDGNRYTTSNFTIMVGDN